MSPRKKSSEPAIVAMAHAAVKENPRGAPEVVPVQWEDVPAVPTVQRLVEVPVVESAPPCALDGAPIGSKCVVSRTDAGKAVRLLNSIGAVTLDTSDIFYTLPTGCKVQKVGEARYVAYRLGVSNEPEFECASAREAVTRFLTND